MKTPADVERLEKIVSQLQSMYAEVTILAKKAPNDAVNAFKLNLINDILKSANEVLGGRYRPFDEFESFDPDDMPSNSDVAVILAQYMGGAERYRSDNVIWEGLRWVYRLDGRESDIVSGPPSKIGKRT